MGIIDTHAHYDDRAFGSAEEQKKLINEIHASGVDAIINCACDKKSLKSTIKLANDFSFVYAALGYHPENLKALEYDDLDVLYDKAEGSQIFEGGKVVAIGEIGLDYHWMASSKEVQKEWFIEQLELSKELELPVIVHSREATEDTLNILKEYREGLVGGVIHAFSGSIEIAREYIKLGFYLGIGGVVSYEDSRKLHNTLKQKDIVPTQRLLLETDCPYLTPVPYRGQRNDSRMIQYTAEAVCRLRGEDPVTFIENCSQNAKELFQLQ